jgi:hypothetical protein
MRYPICAVVVALMWLGIAQASEVKMGMPQQGDAFTATLLASKDLKAAGISLVQTRFPTENEVLDATTEGAVDVGFFPLTALDRREIKGFQKIYSVFTRPFMFKSGDEIFNMEDSALGDAALADLRRAGIFPLKFWNRGFTEACGWEQAPRYLIRTGMGPMVRSSSEDFDQWAFVTGRHRRASHGKNGYAERLIGSIRRECLDHVVVFGERHLRHVLLSDAFVFGERCAGLARRQTGRDHSLPQVLGGPHHQYVRI